MQIELKNLVKTYTSVDGESKVTAVNDISLEIPSNTIFFAIRGDKARSLRSLGQTHYKMISCNIWLPVVIHRSKTRNNALDVFWGIETIIVNLAFS